MRPITDGLTNKQRYRKRHAERLRTEDAVAKRLLRATPEGLAKTKAALSKYRECNRERLAAEARLYRKTEKGRAAEARRIRNPEAPSSHAVYKRYRITPAQRDQMFAEQGGKCKICLDTMSRPNIDHCHISGNVRGILCQRCNIRIGMLEQADFHLWLPAALEYLGVK